MIHWTLIALNEQGEDVIDLMSQSVPYHLRETCQIVFQVWIEEQHFKTVGVPYIIIGDIPIPLAFSHYNNDGRTFHSIEDIDSHKSRYFYNFFGDSELELCFESQGVAHTATVSILARRDNAQLANEMLGFITEHLEDAVSICFSRSKIASGLDDEKQLHFNRLELIEKTVEHLSETLPLFVREHNYTWRTELDLSPQGQPSGPDSVYWVLTHLDRVSPASVDEVNLIYHNRGYRLDELPSERIEKDPDVYENQVITTFLRHAVQFLFEIREQFNSFTESDNAPIDQEYIRFDATMRQYAKLALKHKLEQVDTLVISIEQLKRTFARYLPARTIPGIQPRITPYVARHPHYRKAFELVEQCYKAAAPNFQGTNLLLGLKNLALVYETASLLMIHQALQRTFNVKIDQQCYKVQAENLPFGGIEENRPDGVMNNYFRYLNDNYTIDLLYEPKIYPFSSHSQHNDLVDTSSTRRNKYGAHHFCPDFVVKITSARWIKPLTIVLDAKYKDANTIRRFDIDDLTRKYLLNIHQVNHQGRLGISPVNLLLLMFPHDRNGYSVCTVARAHRLDGTYPVLPQSGAILVKPSDTTRLYSHLNSLIRIMDEDLSCINIQN
ncbi:hypothetical protein [Photobacterium phosphoreum]|uniref:hypothetical protein n=1 Tax=Photobacterium phosphoreum TaxID=659 RepID=UPI0039AF0B7F